MNPSWWKKDLGEFSSLSRQNFGIVKDGALLQVLLIGFAGMILDGGQLLKVVILAALGWWVGLLFILWRRPKTERLTDQLFLKIGFFVLLLGSFFTQPFWGWLR